MRHASQVKVAAVFLSLTAALLAGNRLFAADRTSPAAARPCPHATPTTAEKLKDLGSQLGRALGIAIDLLSNNQADLLSKNKTALLSGNNPKVLSENTTPILSGNTFSVLSNIKIEIHIDNSGNNTAGGAAAQPSPRRAIPSPEPSRTPAKR